MPTEKASTGSLAGIRVIDASRVLGGPFCGQILADHGADVIKIEPPMGDETRGWGPPFAGDAASYFIGVNRNKRDVSIDMTQQAGQELLLRMLEGADVFLENFKIGTLEKWGLSSEMLREKFPRLIHCRVSGFGADGPYGSQPGYDAAVQAMTGLMSVNGEEGGKPLRMGVPIIDLVTGMNAVIGILLALQERAKSGKGQFVEATLYDSGVSMLHPQLPNFYLNGKVPQRSGNRHPNICPYDAFETRTVPLFLAVGNNRQFVTMCKVLGRPEMGEDPRFATNALRNQHRDELRDELVALLGERDGVQVSKELVAAGVPCGPVRTIDQVVEDPHTHHRGMVVDIDDYRGTGAPVKLSRTPASYRSRPPSFAQHTDEVLAELGINPEDYAAVLPRKPVV
ncbi:carnitine dehydratase [Bordetella trematum]|uniref:CaiB/BaiF CoA transferase family protein n=1 Tax=Bordetella trematum TaxID=123899 RepID=UPI00046E8E71|nr:CoA transferase [Bordetella trematum]AUL47009.1 carnitine dehydratase [Bordetella trematum]AZR93808.1 carnitine dehydratase [Bordetella trematum]NNH18928.1 CoA transferase [Bordetella trematum]QIM72390.1 CoA transferase [Bordetella trematum]SAI00757.1 acyl-CoA transferase [Bordetella trematum]